MKKAIGPVATDDEIGTHGTRAFGPSVKAVRRARDMTLDQLAERTGLNKGYLSRLERNEKAPSISTVMKLAQALSVSVSTLFGEVLDDTAIHIVRASARGAVHDGAAGSLYAPLSRAANGSATEAFIIYPRSEFAADDRADHAGAEMIFVLEGNIEVKFPDRSVCLQQGDFMQFPGHVVHQVRRIGCSASALVVITKD